MNQKEILEMHGSYYYPHGQQDIYEADENQAYHFKTYIGTHKIEIAFGDSIYYISENKNQAYVEKGPAKITSHHCATVIN